MNPPGGQANDHALDLDSPSSTDQPPYQKPEVFEASLHFRNARFIVIDKPAGMNFHSEEEAGLVVQVQAQLGVDSLYPVHRLDKMTSGLLILALDKPTAQAFQKMFENRLVEKYYLALSTEKPKKKQGWIKGDMIPARRGSWKLAPTKTQPAITQLISVSTRPNERLFLVNPHTGKTHQIRVALKSIGAPIAGDLRYANVQQAKQEDRGYLHAYALKFELFGEPFEFVCPPSSGDRFLTETCRRHFSLWQAPWVQF